ncbi:hypothetical protein BCIN_10g05110 [Botrytis cinerea B05.10]|uniref:Major facilitator superfamily (MFS) profile domain-containing protein n=2 Tax=Botryotinia fuckeliana TaxID=40559 RepID=A0A384JVB6_BOTFB|nr:hypothetical protein BCIN_10g05110 [Botrytis cinerea B05.10]ATZ54513.1 hypothetical protein BCIN_10g05110 [Botrytis cinerea B05.10]EMR84988.1 putative mfs transporter protein [Botrytis cinerea BcDW1]
MAMEKESELINRDNVNEGVFELSSPASPIPISHSPEEYRKLIWKIDLHVLPALFSLWIVSVVDRGNIGSANIFGIQEDLHMKGNDFNIALLIVVICFIVFDIPCNALLKASTPQIVLTGEIFLLGIVAIGEGLVTSVAGFYAMRFFVGLFEAGLIPGSVYILSQYYPRYEMQWRLGMLMVGNALGTAFSGLLAFAIAGINNDNGYNGWRWIFIIEGCMTVAVAVIAYPFMPTWPHQAKWMSDDEKTLLVSAIKKGVVEPKGEKLDMHRLIEVLKDWKIYIFGIILAFTIMTSASVGIFIPTIVSGISAHQDPRHVQVLCIPVFVAAAVSSFAFSFLSDYFKHRTGFAIFGYVMIIAGAIVLLNQEHVHAHTRYGAVYLLACGIYIAVPIIWTILPNNVAGTYKTGIAIAIQVSIGNLGGVASTLCFASTKAPYFVLGYTTIVWMTCCAAGLLFICMFFLWIENRAREAGKRDYLLERENADKLGDRHPSFRYTY